MLKTRLLAVLMTLIAAAFSTAHAEGGNIGGGGWSPVPGPTAAPLPAPIV